jgi:hypothetical protein
MQSVSHMYKKSIDLMALQYIMGIQSNPDILLLSVFFNDAVSCYDYVALIVEE